MPEKAGILRAGIALRMRIRHSIIFYLLFAFATLTLSLVSCKTRKSSHITQTGISTKNHEQVSAKNNADDQLKFQSTFYNACKEKVKGNVEVAENLFKECLKLYPASAPVKYELAHIYQFAGLQDQALKYAR